MQTSRTAGFNPALRSNSSPPVGVSTLGRCRWPGLGDDVLFSRGHASGLFIVGNPPPFRRYKRASGAQVAGDSGAIQLCVYIC